MFLQSDTGFFGHVGKRFITVVPVEHVTPKVQYVDVFEAISIVVAHCNAMACCL